MRPQPVPVVRFVTPPGRQAQFDFVELRMPWGKLYAVLTVLGCARFLLVSCVPRPTALTLIWELERVFAAFGDVPQELPLGRTQSVVGVGYSSPQGENSAGSLSRYGRQRDDAIVMPSIIGPETEPCTVVAQGIYRILDPGGTTNTGQSASDSALWFGLDDGTNPLEWN
ncbi:MAG: hypothetical protein K2R93_16585 [Gemmatimonadaceae bacterium]|nr:hypothetical protein [Gemmatimonadaceae bacterium]